jgi:hypothetical protein
MKGSGSRGRLPVFRSVKIVPQDFEFAVDDTVEFHFKNSLSLF